VAARLGLPEGVGPVDRNAEGLVEVLLDAVRFHDRSLTLKRLHGWQAALFPTGYSGLKRIRVGRLRGMESMQVVSGPIGEETVHFEALPRERLEGEYYGTSPQGSSVPAGSGGTSFAAALRGSHREHFCERYGAC
jgi:hypothetical protein